MRIVGEIDHPIMKITVMHMNMKYVVKLELGTLEQTYKIRESDYIKKLSDVEKIVDASFCEEVLQRFTAMQNTLQTALQRNLG